MGKVILFLLTPISLFILYYLNIKLPNKFNDTYYALPFTIWFIFYYIGYLTRKNNTIEKLLISKRRFIFIFLTLYLFSLGLSFLEASIIFKNLGNLSFAASQIKVSSFFTSFMIIFLLLISDFKIHKINKLLIYIGDISFGIYLIHMFVLLASRFLLNSLNVSIDSFAFWFLLTFLGSIIIITITKKILKFKCVNYLLGF